jgi:hypothetical protein
MKLVPYFALGQFSPRTLATSAVLLPFAVATNFFGLWLARRTPTEPFYRITYPVELRPNLACSHARNLDEMGITCIVGA